ncbi:tetratricopeptide repeat protein [Paenibacillus lentus]|uniref:Tetratricopeptide repeat protein n=1 Tax=Paenibacillus lentus TaxID=1338368 RepID=A0A3S8RW05_9BACL|nr:tetratricopeptide repeat protein [Paenibacillus lentus]AZK47199.1 tetratricopeptide repeat protein [Paenibacillus lentus]
MQVEQYLKKAYRSIFDNDFEGAIHWFEQALSEGPDNADIHYRLSITCARSDRLEKAIHHARLAATLEPAHLEYKSHYDRLQSKELTVLAKKQLEQANARHKGLVKSAVTLLERAVHLDPLSVIAMLWLAIAYGELQQYSLALRAVQEAAQLPQDEAITKQLQKLEQRFKSEINQSSS